MEEPSEWQETGIRKDFNNMSFLEDSQNYMQEMGRKTDRFSAGVQDGAHTTLANY